MAQTCSDPGKQARCQYRGLPLPLNPNINRSVPTAQILLHRQLPTGILEEAGAATTCALVRTRRSNSRPPGLHSESSEEATMCICMYSENSELHKSAGPTASSSVCMYVCMCVYIYK